MDEHSKADGADLGHFEKLPDYRVPRTNFDLALHALTGTSYRLKRDGRRAAMRAALDNCATWGQIKHWRAGRRRPPQWAIDLLNRKIDERTAELQRGRAA